jgi:hypothetical protein
MKVLGITPSIKDAINFYRLGYPLSTMKRVVENFTYSIKEAHEVTLQDIYDCDRVLFQRPYHPNHLALCMDIKAMGKKLVLDYDDHLLGIDPWNPHFEVYNACRETLVKIKLLADVTIYSTNYLKNVDIEALGDPKSFGYHVIPNALDNCFYHESQPSKHSPIAFWRGSKGHIKDLMDHAEIFRKSSIRSRYTFLGLNPFFLNAPYNYMDWKSLPQYFQMIKEMSPEYFFCFLVDTPFNRSKSNIGFLEAVASGAKYIIGPGAAQGAPSFEEWSLCPNLFEVGDVFEDAIAHNHDELLSIVRHDYNLDRFNERRLMALS